MIKVVVIDKRISIEEMSILQNLVGKVFISLHHDEFHFVNSSSQLVGIETELGMTYLYSFTEPLDYYGSIEDVAVWELSDKKYGIVDEKQLITSPVKETIKEIQVVQEHQMLFENNQQTYDVWVTRGIIFDFGDHQFALEKLIWFSEDIYIHKGYGLIEKFSPIENFVKNDWAENITAECIREIITIK